MFSDLTKNDLHKKIAGLRKELKKLAESEEIESRRLGDWLMLRDDPRYIERTALESALNRLDHSGREVLKENANKALAKSKEFSGLDSWHGGLYMACNDSNVLGYTGDSRSTLKIFINLDLTAGTAEDYGNAVIAARDKMAARGNPDTKHFVRTAATKSNFWKNFLYKPAREGMKTPKEYKMIQNAYAAGEVYEPPEEGSDTDFWVGAYWETMEMRQEAFQGLAPWWEILDRGSFIDMPSNLGGVAYPLHPPTNFVSETILELERKVKDWSVDEENEFRSDINANVENAEENLRQYRTLIEELDEKVAKYIRELGSRTSDAEIQDWIGEVQAKYRFVKGLVEGRIEKQAEGRKYNADPVKVRKLADDIMAGRDVGTRIRLGGGVRIRLIQLLKEYKATLMEYR